MAETRMGGSREAFPETAWSSILHAPAEESPRRREALNRLCAAYWRPVYKTLRASWNRSIEEAKDLTQEFFHEILESGFVGRYRPEKGRFRHFLRGALQSFMTQTRRDASAQKRGGGRAPLSLDVDAVEAERFLEDARSAAPDEVFDRQWAAEVLARGLDRLRRELEAEGRSDHYRAYDAYELSPPDPASVTYEEVAARTGLSAQQVKSAIDLVRARLRRILAEVVADGVSTREELLDELDQLFSA